MEAEARNPAQPLPMISWEMLEKSFAHPNALIREKAIETSSSLPDPRVLPALQAAFRDPDSRIQSAAARAFGGIAERNSAEMVGALGQVLRTSPDSELRLFLIAKGAQAMDGPLLEAVISSLVDATPVIREAAERALGERASPWMLTKSAGKAMPAIEAALHAPEAEVRAMASRWTEQLRQIQVRRTMLDTGVASMLTLTNALRSPSALLRAAAAWALQQRGDNRAVPALIEALGDTDESVRLAAGLALAELRWSASTEGEHAAHLAALGRWEAAAGLGPCAVDVLILAANNSTPATQVSAIQALGETRSVRALLPLQRLLESAERPVRKAAAVALKTLEWVPASPAQALRQSLELENWNAVAALGAEGVAPLMNELKFSHDNQERRTAITAALVSLPNAAAPALATCCRDGEVAAAAVQALASVLERAGDAVPEALLREIAAWQSVVQFRFTMDSHYQKPVRSGMEFVDLSGLKHLAGQELARRSAIATREAAT